MITKITNKIKEIYYHSSFDKYRKYLINKGVSIGDGTYIAAKTARIDLTRPSLIKIGKDCYMNENFTLLTHDWVTKVFINTGRDFLPSSGRVTIGNNVSFGQNVMVLKGVTIGDNCFIGANSLVTKDIPANSVAVGSPCRVVCSIEEFYQKRKKQCIDEALDYARSIQERFNRIPVTTDFWEEFPLFVDGNKLEDYPELAETIKRQCGPTKEKYVKEHKANYDGFDAFLVAAGIK